MRRVSRPIRRIFSRGVNVLMFTRAAPLYARYTARFHLPAELLIGAFGGVFALNDLLAKGMLGLRPGFAVSTGPYAVSGLLTLRRWGRIRLGSGRLSAAGASAP